MADPIKFTDDELTNLKELRTNNANIVSQFGQIEMEKFLTGQRLSQLDEAKHQLTQQLEKLQERETTLVKELNDKYGAGTVDIDSGVFVPNS